MQQQQQVSVSTVQHPQVGPVLPQLPWKSNPITDHFFKKYLGYITDYLFLKVTKLDFRLLICSVRQHGNDSSRDLVYYGTKGGQVNRV